MTMQNRVDAYFDTLAALPGTALATNLAGESMSLGDFYSTVISAAQSAHEAGYKVMFVGNGGSASVASHMSIDFPNNGGIRGMGFNDSSALTCLGNDYGYENVFSRQVEIHARAGDILIAISSSGQSENILNAVNTARSLGCMSVTLSGFKPDNPLRSIGDLNLYVSSNEYGFVEISHLSLCHAIHDLATGWGKVSQNA